jgi:hypothetical protein
MSETKPTPKSTAWRNGLTGEAREAELRRAAAQQRKRRAARSEEQRLAENADLAVRGKKHYEENKETYNARSRARFRTHRDDARGYHLLRTYGISLEQEQEMLRAQGGACALCLRLFEPGTLKARKLARNVDHCHATGKVRGLLCTKCNNGLGSFEDNPETCRRAAEYLLRSRDASSYAVEEEDHVPDPA